MDAKHPPKSSRRKKKSGRRRQKEKWTLAAAAAAAAATEPVVSEQPTRSTTSRLLSLPPELRNQIYDYIFNDATFHVHGEDTQPALTRTCHLLRTETLPLFYSSTHLQLDMQWKPSQQTWLCRPHLPSDSCLSHIQWLTLTFRKASIECYFHIGAEETITRVYGCAKKKHAIQDQVRALIDLNDGKVVVSRDFVGKVAQLVYPQRSSTHSKWLKFKKYKKML